MKTNSYWHVQSLPERPPRVRTSQTRSNSLSSKCCSTWLPLFFWTNAWKCYLTWLPLRMLRKNERTHVKDQCQEHITHDLTRPRPSPGEFICEQTDVAWFLWFAWKHFSQHGQLRSFVRTFLSCAFGTSDLSSVFWKTCGCAISKHNIKDGCCCMARGRGTRFSTATHQIYSGDGSPGWSILYLNGATVGGRLLLRTNHL